MKKYFSFCYTILFILFSTFVFGQNLIPNGSFENYKSCVNNREVAVQDAAPWYNAGGTSDAYQFNCNNNLFQSIINIPFDGDVYLGFGGGPNAGGGFAAEGIAVELTEPLEAGRNYYLEAKVRGIRINVSDNNTINRCKTIPRRQFGIYLAQDSFKINWVLVNQEIVDSYCNGQLIFADSTNPLVPSFSASTPSNPIPEELIPWQTVSVCIKAEGGEKYIGFAPNVGKFEVEPACSAYNPNLASGIYYNVDDVKLLKFPEQLVAEKLICTDKPIDIHLRKLVPMPMFDEAIFRWSDGQIDSVRRVYQGGTEIIEVITPCDTTMLTLDLIEEDCRTHIFVPTAFSPHNYDGINDEIKPFIKNYWEITNYEFQIFNRWGQQLFVTNDYNSAWNGLVNGEEATEGVYVWMVKYEQLEDGILKLYTKSGDFTLMK